MSVDLSVRIVRRINIDELTTLAVEEVESLLGMSGPFRLTVVELSDGDRFAPSSEMVCPGQCLLCEIVGHYSEVMTVATDIGGLVESAPREEQLQFTTSVYGGRGEPLKDILSCALAIAAARISDAPILDNALAYQKAYSSEPGEFRDRLRVRTESKDVDEAAQKFRQNMT